MVAAVHLVRARYADVQPPPTDQQRQQHLRDGPARRRRHGMAVVAVHGTGHPDQAGHPAEERRQHVVGNRRNTPPIRTASHPPKPTNADPARTRAPRPARRATTPVRSMMPPVAPRSRSRAARPHIDAPPRPHGCRGRRRIRDAARLGERCSLRISFRPRRWCGINGKRCGPCRRMDSVRSFAVGRRFLKSTNGHELSFVARRRLLSSVVVDRCHAGCRRHSYDHVYQPRSRHSETWGRCSPIVESSPWPG